MTTQSARYPISLTWHPARPKNKEQMQTSYTCTATYEKHLNDNWNMNINRWQHEKQYNIKSYP